MADSGDSAATIAAAREREKRLRSITRTAPDAIVIIDETGTIDTVNPAAERLFGYSGAELVGQNVKILMPSPHREAHDSHLARYRETGEKRVIGIGRVVVGRRKDGTTFPARLAIGEIELDQGRLFTGFIHDITERETIQRRAGILQQELMHASRLSAMGEMASGIAHELNQPLTAVMNYTRAARRRLDRPEADPAPIADLVDKAGQAGGAGGRDHQAAAALHQEGRQRPPPRAHQRSCRRSRGAGADRRERPAHRVDLLLGRRAPACPDRSH